MAVAEAKHFRGRPKKKTRVVPPPKDQTGPPRVEQEVECHESQMVLKPRASVPAHPHGKQRDSTVHETCVAKATSSPLWRLKKAAGRGEGSHGGHIIGHTHSGKPIYAADHPSHGGFSRKEHLAAREAHLGAATIHSALLRRLKNHGADEYDQDFVHTDDALVHHVQMAAQHLTAAGGLPKKTGV